MNLGTDTITTSKAHSNLDYFYGPYNSLIEALHKVPRNFRKLGLTVGVIEKGSVIEYLWKRGIEDKDLVLKIEEYKVEIKSISHTIDVDKNEITFTINTEGKGLGIQTSIYLNSNKISTVPTLLNLDLVITISAPENPGNYTYTISIIDSILGNGALENYEVTWKEVDAKILPSSSIFSYLVKSLSNLINSSFSFQIYKIDSLDIEQISIKYGESEFSLFQEGDTYYDIYTVNIESLAGLKPGDLILIKINSSGLSLPFIKDVVQLTSPGVVSQCLGSAPSEAFNGVSFSTSFYFEAENVGNYLVVIKDNDTEIYNSSLLSYNTNILSLKLIDDTLSESKLSSQHTLKVFVDNSEIPNYTFNTLTLKWVSQSEVLENLDGNTFFLDDFNKFSELGEGEILTLNSYILDTSVYIPYSESSNSLFLFANITINKDVINFRNIKYPTPIQLNISIGFMCNVKTSYLGKEYYYDALFINGVLCSKLPHDSSNPSNITINKNTIDDVIDLISNKIRFYYRKDNPIELSPENFIIEKNYKARNPEAENSNNLPIFNITPISNILTKANLTQDLINSITSDGKITIENTVYNVIDTTKYKVGKFGKLGETKYRIDDLIRDFCSSYGVSNSGDDTLTIGILKKKVKKDPSKIPNNYLTLMALIVASKPLLQKYVAIPCEWEYNGKHGYLLAYTLGTSTLEYALPNFTFKFFTIDKSFSTSETVELIPKINRNIYNILNYSNTIDSNTQFFREKELVAKADYMESSHLNNTPTAMFYNSLTTQENGYSILNNGQEFKILKNPTVDKLNAIEGIPVILNIEGVNYGSFMLNIGKAGESIGFGDTCISLEGTSNDDNSGMSSRFDFSPYDTAAKDYIDGITNIDEVDTINDDFVSFLNGGLEYRSSGKDLGDIGENENKVEGGEPIYSEYLRILKMWYWVYKHETYTKELFSEMFDFDFAALYYIQMMVFGQTDNLGKNCMFDQFTEDGKWYVRPYDMDSLAGLNNNGFDNLAPVIEISPEFVLDEATKDIKLITYLGKSDSVRFPYSSKNSNLWIRFYKNLRRDIESFYKDLRNLGYSAEAIISVCEKEVINKLGINLYNIDFLNKYLSNLNSEQLFAYGNRWIKFKDWILKRFDFCDTYFGYNTYSADTTGTGIEYTIKYALPLYTIYKYNNLGGEMSVTNWGTECVLKFEGTTKLTIQFSPKYIIDDDGIFLSGFSSLNPRVKLNNLVRYSGDWNNLCNVVDLSENTYLQYMIINSINTTGDATIPNSIKELSINNSTLIPQLEDFNNLTSITFSNCEGNIYLSNCPNLKTININSSKNINLTLINCGNENNYLSINNTSTTFNKIILNGCYINCLNLPRLNLNTLSFTGSDSHINIVNLYRAKILNLELDISKLITETLILNHIAPIKIKTSEIKSFSYLGLDGAGILLWGTTENTFDGSYLNTTGLRSIRVLDTTEGSTIEDIVLKLIKGEGVSRSNLTTFRLYACSKIKYVTNLNVDLTVTNLKVGPLGLEVGLQGYLFGECSNLKKVTNSNIKGTGRYMFYRCYNLDELPVDSNEESTIELTTTDGFHMFDSCLKLTYSDIKKVLERNTIELNGTISCKLTDYTDFLYNKSYWLDTTIDLSDYAFATSIQFCFSSRAFSNDPTTNKNTSTLVTITYEGKLPSSLLDASYAFASIPTHKYIVPNDIFEDCLNLTNLSYCFARNTADNSGFKVPKLPITNRDLALNRVFSGSIVNIYNLLGDGSVQIPSNTTSCYSLFNNATIYCYEETFDNSPVEISNIFKNCTKLTNITNCFRKCNNFNCTSPLNLQNNNVDINIAGIFAENYSNSTIKYGFNSAKWYSDPADPYYLNNDASSSTMSESNRVGPYYNTTIDIPEEVNISNISKPMKNVLQKATINNENQMSLKLTINTKDCSSICLELNFAKENESTLRIVLNSIELANRAFYKVSIFDTDNISVPNSLINASYMFANSNISNIPLLNECSNLLDISYMFLNCTNIKGDKAVIPTIGGYFLPISITNINYLFDGCLFLHGGIPESESIQFVQTQEIQDPETQEFITVRNNILELICTFSRTSIFYEGNEYKPLNISEIFPKVTNVTGLFYYMWSNSYPSLNRLELHNLCFSKCTNCNDLFNSSIVTIPSNCDFKLALYMRFAFALSRDNTVRNLTNIEIGPRVDISGIFSSEGDSQNRVSEVLNNLETLQQLKNNASSYTGMLFGYSEDTTKEEFRLIEPTRSIRYSSHA